MILTPAGMGGYTGARNASVVDVEGRGIVERRSDGWLAREAASGKRPCAAGDGGDVKRHEAPSVVEVWGRLTLWVSLYAVRRGQTMPNGDLRRCGGWELSRLFIGCELSHC